VRILPPARWKGACRVFRSASCPVRTATVAVTMKVTTWRCMAIDGLKLWLENPLYQKLNGDGAIQIFFQTRKAGESDAAM